MAVETRNLWLRVRNGVPDVDEPTYDDRIGRPACPYRACQEAGMPGDYSLVGVAGAGDADALALLEPLGEVGPAVGSAIEAVGW
jgi:hypothetical protein